MLENTPDVLTVKDLMLVLKIRKNKALSLLHESKITGHTISCGRWRIFKEDVAE